MEVVIEIPKVEDFKRVNELARQVHKLHVNWRPDLFLDVEEIISKENFEEMIQEETILIAKCNNVIEGYVTFKILEKDNPSMRHRIVLSIDAICVDESNRGNGIGTKLLEYLKYIGKEKGCTDMDLTVNEENEGAIKLYEKFGFKIKSLAYSMQI